MLFLTIVAGFLVLAIAFSMRRTLRNIIFPPILIISGPPASGSQFDVIIVGAGTGGCVAAAELARRAPSLRVAVLERGGSFMGLWRLARVPLLARVFFPTPAASPSAAESTVPTPSGVGGASCVSHMAWHRGGAAYWDSVSAAAGAAEWGWAGVGADFDALEAAYAARGGLLPPPPPNPIAYLWATSAGPARAAAATTHAEGDPGGVAFVAAAVDADGRRLTAADVFAPPAVHVGVRVRRVVTEGSPPRVVGVELEPPPGAAAGTPPTRVGARFVIAAAGALGTAALFSASGGALAAAVRPAADAVVARVVCEARPGVTWDTAAGGIRAWLAWLLRGAQPLRSPAAREAVQLPHGGAGAWSVTLDVAAGALSAGAAAPYREAFAFSCAVAAADVADVASASFPAADAAAAQLGCGDALLRRDAAAEERRRAAVVAEFAVAARGCGAALHTNPLAFLTTGRSAPQFPACAAGAVEEGGGPLEEWRRWVEAELTPTFRPAGWHCGTAPLGASLLPTLAVRGVGGAFVADASALPAVPPAGPLAAAHLCGYRAAAAVAAAAAAAAK